MGVEAKQVKLLLVGPDCSGKSLLSSRLGLHYSLEIFRNRRIDKPLPALQSVVDFAMDWFADEEGFILDQWQFPVDIIYNHTLRDQSSVFEALAPYLKEEMDDNKVLIIHLTADDRTLRSRFDRRGDELWDIKQILEVAKAYKPWLQKLNLTHTTIDTSELTPEEVFQTALARIEKFYGGGK